MKSDKRYNSLIRLATEQFGTKPEFLVQVVSNYNGNSRLLQWGYVPPCTLPHAKFYGRYACFPLKVHDGGKLIEKLPEEHVEEQTVLVTRKLMEQIAETLISGMISDEVAEGVRNALFQK